MNEETDSKKIKLVRMVLFPDPWQNRDGWKECLANAAAQNTSITIHGLSISLEGAECQGEGKAIRRYRYTGPFPQYSLLNNPDAKLFDKYEIWRFIEVYREAGNEILIDSYIYFCKDMTWKDSFTIEKFTCLPDDNVFDGAFRCEYRQGTLYWAPLPLPKVLECYVERKEIQKYAVFHHGNCEVMGNEWTVVDKDGGFFQIYSGHRDGLFSSVVFYERIKMDNTKKPERIRTTDCERIIYIAPPGLARGIKLGTYKGKMTSVHILQTKKEGDSLLSAILDRALLDGRTVVYVHISLAQPYDRGSYHNKLSDLKFVSFRDITNADGQVKVDADGPVNEVNHCSELYRLDCDKPRERSSFDALKRCLDDYETDTSKDECLKI